MQSEMAGSLKYVEHRKNMIQQNESWADAIKPNIRSSWSSQVLLFKTRKLCLAQKYPGYNFNRFVNVKCVILDLCILCQCQCQRIVAKIPCPWVSWRDKQACPRLFAYLTSSTPAFRVREVFKNQTPKTAFFGPKTLFLGQFLTDFFLAEKGGYPPPPLSGRRPAKKLAEKS